MVSTAVFSFHCFFSSKEKWQGWGTSQNTPAQTGDSFSVRGGGGREKSEGLGLLPVPCRRQNPCYLLWTQVPKVSISDTGQASGFQTLLRESSTMPWQLIFPGNCVAVALSLPQRWVGWALRQQGQDPEGGRGGPTGHSWLPAAEDDFSKWLIAAQQ